jgi:hypothetical protein
MLTEGIGEWRGPMALMGQISSGRTNTLFKFNVGVALGGPSSLLPMLLSCVSRMWSASLQL